MDRDQLLSEIKALIVEELNLQGKDPASIEDDAPLFGPPAERGDGTPGVVGLGLDSLDALQLAMSIEERFGVRIPEGEDARAIFRSARALADHVSAHAPGAPAGT